LQGNGGDTILKFIKCVFPAPHSVNFIYSLMKMAPLYIKWWNIAIKFRYFNKTLLKMLTNIESLFWSCIDDRFFTHNLFLMPWCIFNSSATTCRLVWFFPSSTNKKHFYWSCHQHHASSAFLFSLWLLLVRIIFFRFYSGRVKI
jgi:hypothetical protein